MKAEYDMRKKAFLFAALGIVILVSVVLIRVSQPKAAFDGDRIASADPPSFSLRFNVMNKEDAHTLSLQEGDTLAVSWLIESGSVDVLIAMEGEPSLYQANGRGKGDEAAFDLTIPKTGDYAITVSGKNAKGWLHFEGVNEQAGQ